MACYLNISSQIESPPFLPPLTGQARSCMLILLYTEKTSGFAVPGTFCAVHGWDKLLCQMVQRHASKCGICFSITLNRQLPWKKPTSSLTSTSHCFPATLYFLDLHCRSFAEHQWSSLTTPDSVRGSDVSNCLYPLKLDVALGPSYSEWNGGQVLADTFRKALVVCLTNSWKQRPPAFCWEQRGWAGSYEHEDEKSEVKTGTSRNRMSQVVMAVLFPCSYC